jgi:predicted nucleic acid-binding protein
MARTILIDANVIEQIGRGNQQAANAMRGMIANGDTLYVTQQSYNEMVRNPAIPRTGVAKQEFLREMNVGIAPAGNAAERGAAIGANTTRGGNAILGAGDIQVAAHARGINGEVWSFDRGFRLNGNAVRTTLGVQVAPECGLPMANGREDYRVARRLVGLPEINIDLNGRITRPTQPGRGAPGKPFASATPGFDPEGTNLKMMGGIMALGAIVGWLDDYFIDEAMNKDISEWESYIQRRQTLDPTMGFLLVATIKVWQPRDAAYPTRSYVGIDMFEADSLIAATVLARKKSMGGLAPPTETVHYEFPQMWVRPLNPKPRISSVDADAKAHGSEFWYPGFKRLWQSLESPPDYGEALSVLVGSWMVAMIRILDHLRSFSPRQFENLKNQLRSLREPINQARVGLAFRAVEEHGSDSSFGLQTFLSDTRSRSYYDMLPPDQQREIAEWVQSGSGALKHVMQGQWEVTMNGQKFLYSFRLAGTVIYRNAGSGEIAAEGTWTASSDGVRVKWPKTGTVEYFPAPLRTTGQSAKSVTKWGGTFEMQARKVNPYP